ncbi:MAG TPA: hypothetical protein VGJ18_19685 [Gemmatimonadaceae bacterium]
MAQLLLLRGAAPANVYRAVVQMANAAAADLHALTTRPALYVSVQADEGWGRLLHGNVYRGVETDFHDFPFMEALALSHPYFVFAEPNDIPLDYYTRLANGRALPVLVVEGGGRREQWAQCNRHRRRKRGISVARNSCSTGRRRRWSFSWRRSLSE